MAGQSPAGQRKGGRHADVREALLPLGRLGAPRTAVRVADGGWAAIVAAMVR